MLTQTFTYKVPLKIGKYKISHDVIYSVKISNIELKNGLVHADVTYKSNNIKKFNKIKPEEISSSKTVSSDLSLLVADPCVMYTQFEQKEKIPATNVKFTFEIEEPAADAPAKVKDFYKKHFNENAVKDLWKKIEEYLTKETKSIENNREARTAVAKAVSGKLSFFKNPWWVTPMVGVMLFVALQVLLGLILPPLAAAFSLTAFKTIAVHVLLTLHFTHRILAFVAKDKLWMLNNLGELDNESIDTPEGKTHLISKLVNLYDIKPEEAPEYKAATEYAIDIGEKSYGSLFARFKSCFNTGAYHYGYYVAQELAAKKVALKP